MGEEDQPTKRTRRRTVLTLTGVLGVLLVAGGAGTLWLLRPTPFVPPSPPFAPQTVADIRTFCQACHAYPSPDTFPRFAWAGEIKRAYGFADRSELPLQPPPFETVVRYFEEQAPNELPPALIEHASGPVPVPLTRDGFAGPPQPKPPAVSNVSLVHLFDKKRLDVLVCDMRTGRIMTLSPYESVPTWRLLGLTPNPAHTTVVDLDKDGILDVLVANLGSMLPTEELVGSVTWLRGTPDGEFTPITLLEGVGRVADVRAADFDGDGKLDLVVAAFGRNETGEIYALTNRTQDWSRPRFERRVLDARHGAIHVPVCDLTNDGKPDFVALISQEHETIVAFLNEGGGRFRKEVIHTAPHPGYGSSGIELVDLDGDGDLDVLYTNGDVFDGPPLLKPYHGVQWLENQGGFPFAHHSLGPMYGASRAVAGDIDGDGRLDVLAVSFLPEENFPQREELGLDAVILLRQTEPRRFARYTLSKGACDHPTCAAGDIFGTGRIDFVTGNFLPRRAGDAVSIWKNSPPKKDR
jgi:hypothetical protein